MKKWRGLVVIVAGLAAILVADGGRGSAAPPVSVSLPSQAVCAAAAPGSANCHAIVVVNSSGKPNVTANPSGYGPADIRSAYNLGSSSSGGRTVAIVDAYDDPTAANDLAAYRSQFGLPACISSCFTKVNQNGSASPLPSANSSWAAEISLDLDMVSATCPDCHILLVEANSSSFADLSKAVTTAASMGAVAISNSYGGTDTNGASYPAYNNVSSAIAVTASTGDNGYGVEAPASFAHVVAVGGTSLFKSGSTYSEKAWSGAGSGCSKQNLNPGWQSGTQCNGKANADVSAVADPNTGVAVYDTTALNGRTGWMVFGGTSVASPIIASVYALAGNYGSGTYAGQYTWGHKSGLHDVISGSNAHHCSPSLWCTAGQGWDGPTGLGTPNGLSNF